MKRVIWLIIVLTLLVGCEEIVTYDYLQEGKWIATAGYKDDENKGEPECPVIKGLDFKDENTVYIDHIDEEFEYSLSDERDGQLAFYSEPLSLRMRFDTIIVDENSMAIEGQGRFEDQVCYMERQTK
ncbi:hypothetical protein [Oceanobacillus kimchii]|uniref:hypothetical protein n=1 Tax=Oceanobacillus kimchii TaxID=746691 RepID=UPI003C786316